MAISGDSGGMDSFSALGSQIHEDSLESMDYFQQLEQARRDRERQDRLDNDDRRKFKLGNAQINRRQNLAGMDMLSQQRAGAQSAANRRPNTFRNAMVPSRTGAV